ncbi:fibronectin type III domain-containing protein [Brachybacterium phenoliresistens]|uniref:fibronectin type III domain-containing protein n=1 Tax=Brachybacterium phenoliresistens TaxID=396014 RepID=UPI0031CE8E15
MRHEGDTVTVTWDPAWCRVTGYRIEHSTDGTTWSTAGVTHSPALATSATITASTPVRVRVTTINEAGESTPVTA